jgi:hypothetical protein
MTQKDETRGKIDGLSYRLTVFLLIGVVIGLLLGFFGGRFQGRLEAPGIDKFLDWPFLLLICTVFLVIVFKENLEGVLNRDLTLKWGDKIFKVRELPDKLDEEIDPIGNKVNDALADIQKLKEAIKRLQPESKTGEKSSLARDASADKELIINTVVVPIEEVHCAAVKKMKEALSGTEYRWRSLERLAAIAGLPEGQALNILRSDSDIVLGRGKTGDPIARLKSV